MTVRRFVKGVPQTVPEAVAYIMGEMPVAAQDELRARPEVGLTLRYQTAWAQPVVDAINRFGMEWPVWKDLFRVMREAKLARTAADPDLARFAARYPDLVAPEPVHHDDLFHALLVEVWRAVRSR